VVQKALVSADKHPLNLTKGLLGTVAHVDEEGDAAVKFDGTEQLKWVLAKDNYKLSTVHTDWSNFNLGSGDIACIACVGFWGTYDPRPEYNLKSVSAILDKCPYCKASRVSSLNRNDVWCIACSQFWSTYDARPEYNLRSVSEVLSECPHYCPQYAGR